MSLFSGVWYNLRSENVLFFYPFIKFTSFILCHRTCPKGGRIRSASGTKSVSLIGILACLITLRNSQTLKEST